MSPAVTAEIAAPSASISASFVRACALRNIPFIFENACSIGLRSGEYAGRKSSSQPRPSMSSRTSSLLWAERLSITTTCPGFEEGANTRSTYASKTALFVEPRTARVGPIPSELMLAKSVVFLPRLRGVLQYARLPRRDQACRGASEVLAPISSTNTKRLASRASQTSARQAALKNSSRSLAPTVLFFG